MSRPPGRRNSIRTLMLFHEEARHIHAGQLHTRARTENKANQMMVLNSTLLAVAVAGAQFLIPTGPHHPLADVGAYLVAVGGLCLLAAVAMSVMAFMARDVPEGLRAEDLRTAFETGTRYPDFLRAATAAYLDADRIAKDERHSAARAVAWTVRLSLAGLGAVAGGAGILIVAG